MGASSIEDMLFPGIDVRLEGTSVTAAALFVDAAACGRPACCPSCRWRGRRVHSTYRRNLSERPLRGQKLVVRLRVRRFFCDRKSCARRTFVEQVARLTERHRRSSLGLKEWLTMVAVELGGRPGERLCRKLNLAAGRTRLVGLLEEPPAPGQAPRVLGVDEFAFRRGRRYGTILVDVEAGQVVDVLPDRSSGTFAAWLTAHPGAEIICRDRASAYTKAIKEAAPAALEIADRWHLLQNLSDAVEKTCHQHRPCLKKHAERGGDRPIRMPLVDALPPTRIVQRVLHHHAEVTRMVAVPRSWMPSSRTCSSSTPQVSPAARHYSSRSASAGSAAVTRHSPPTCEPCMPARPGRSSGNPEPAQDHLMDHAKPRPPQPQRDRAPRPGPPRLPGHRPGV